MHAKLINRWIAIGMGIGLWGGVVARGIEPGDSREAVLRELGSPRGSLAIGSREVLTYERGEVELVDRVVIQTDLVSTEEALARRQAREAEEARRREQARKQRAQRLAEGTEIYARKISDPVFMNSSAAERTTYWRNFAKLYPEVELGGEVQQAFREYDLEVAAQRAAVAEQEARQAELERQSQARAESSSSFYGYDHPMWIHPYPPVVHVPERRPNRPNRPVQRPIAVRPDVRIQPVDMTPGAAFQRPR